MNANTRSGLSLDQGSGAGALAGYTIVEIGLDEAGQYGCMLLARLGARVVKLESLAGEPTRRLPPFAEATDGTRRSVPYEFLNAGKQSVAVDLEDAFIFEQVESLVGEHGAIVTAPAYAERLPKTQAVPVIVAGPQGAGDANADLPSTPFTRYHAGGNAFLVPGDRPVMPGTRIGECFAGAGIAMCVLGLCLMRLGRPQGGPLSADYSEQAHAVNLEKLFVGRASKEGIEPSRESHRYPFGGAVRCSDGYVSMLIFEEHQWRGLCRVIERPEWATDPSFKGWAGRASRKDEIEAELRAWCGSRTMREILDIARPHGVAIGAVHSLDQVLDNAWMLERGFLREAETAFGPAAVVGLPFGTHPLWLGAMREFAPVAGEDSAAVMRELGHDDERLELLETLQLVRYGHAAV